MINFPIFNPSRSVADNNRARKTGAVKPTQRTAEVEADKPVATAERRSDNSEHAEARREERKAKYIDIEV